MSTLADLLSGRDHVILRQEHVASGELLNFAPDARFAICDEQGEQIGLAAEEGHMLALGFGVSTGAFWRGATLHVFNARGATVATAKKPFRMYAKRVDVVEGARALGSVVRRWSWLSRRLVIENAAGEAAMELIAPRLRIKKPTFSLRFQGEEVGRVTKEWRGVLREAFTDHDAFVLEFEPRVPVELRGLLLFAALLIDSLHFTSRHSR